MKKRMVALLCVAAAMILVACGAKSGSQVSESDDKTAEVSGDTEPEADEKTEEDDTDSTDEESLDGDDSDDVHSKFQESKAEGTLITEDGQYYMTMMSSMYHGEPDDSNFGTLESAKFTDGYLVVNGSINKYKDLDSYDLDTDNVLFNSTYSFRVNEDTQYLSVGGDAEPQPFTQEEFAEYTDECKDSGLGFIIVVEKGYAVEVDITS